MTYVDEIVVDLERRLPWGELPEADRRVVACFYAALTLAKGGAIEAGDVHDAWACAMTAMGRWHASIVPFSQLEAEARSKDEPFASALRSAAHEMRHSTRSQGGNG